MKKILIIVTILLGIISCKSNNTEITQAKFERLLTHDSISSISINKITKQVQISVKPFHENDKKLFFPVESSKSFEVSLDKLVKKLSAQNIHPNYSIVIISSASNIPFHIPLVGLIVSILTLLLFLFCIIDVLRNKFESSIIKLIWLLVVFFLPLIGSILYIFIGMKQKLAKN